MSSHAKTRCGQPCVTQLKKKKNTRYFRVCKPKPQSSSHLRAWGFLHFSFGASQKWNSKLPMSWARSLIRLFSKKGATTRLFLVEGLLKPKSPHSWTSLLEFHTSFSMKKLVSDRTGPPGMSYKACLQADVWTRARCH